MPKNIFICRLLTVIMWFSLSIGSLSWWRKISALAPEDPPIWWPLESAQFLPRGWVFFAFIAAALSVLYIFEIYNTRPAKLKHIILWVFVFGLCAVFVYPLGSKDIFYYISFARLQSFYGLSPHLANVSDICNYLSDPFLKNTYNITVISAYGPLWTWFSSVLYYFIAGLGLLPFIISFKVLGLIMHLLIMVVIYRIADTLSEGSGSRAAIIYGMNPLAIFELVANAHNDGPAILMLLLALLLSSHKKILIGLAALGTAISFKFTAVLTVPFFVLRTAKDRGLFYAGLGTVIAALIPAFFYSLANVNIFEVIRLSTAGFLNLSFTSLAYDLAGENAVIYARIVGLILFLFWYYILWRKLSKENMKTLSITIALGIIAYFLFGAFMVHRWYYLWPLAVAAVTPYHPWAKAVTIQTIILFLCYILILSFGEKIDKSVTYILALIPILVIGLLHYRQRSTY